jgi:hypothetical protein
MGIDRGRNESPRQSSNGQEKIGQYTTVVAHGYQRAKEDWTIACHVQMKGKGCLGNIEQKSCNIFLLLNVHL